MALTTADGRALLLRSLALLPPAGTEPRPLLLAVSGGPDSLALLLLAAENRAELRSAGFSPFVATVDHRLRAASAAESATVSDLCAELGLPHATLPWEGDKPAASLAAAARDARYRLLVEHAENLGAAAILTAHHEDDQIETHLLAAARRAGDRGLAGMRVVRWLSPGVALLRPFLGVPGAVLKETVSSRGVAAVDDPSNGDPRFERARLRARLALEPSERAALISAIAGHAVRRDAADAALAGWMRETKRGGQLTVDDRGVVRCAAEPFRALEKALAIAFLSRVLPAAGGALYPPPRASIEALLGRIPAYDFVAATLGGAVIRRTNDFFTFFREFGRSGPPFAKPAEQGGALFDRRFLILCLNFKETFERSEFVAFGSLGGTGAIDRTLPVLVSCEGEVIAAHPALVERRLRSVPELRTEQRVSFRLFADLP